MTDDTREKCRGCGKSLVKLSQIRAVSDDERRESAQWHHYGGFVCSERCDEKVMLDMHSSFPGAGRVEKMSIDMRRQMRSWEPTND